MKVVIFGPGRIGCGFAGHLLRSSGYNLVFATRNPQLADHLNRVGRYAVQLVSSGGTQHEVVDGVHAITLDNPRQLIAELVDADLIATAVGLNNLSAVAPMIAAGLAQRRTPTNVLAFENGADVATMLRTSVAGALPTAQTVEAHGFSAALVSRVVPYRLGDPAADEPLTFVGDIPATFIVDRDGLQSPLPCIHGMVVTDNFAAWVERKLYMYSAGHATTAYLGYLKGYRYIHTAIRDDEIQAAVMQAMKEAQQGLAACYGTELAGDERDLLEIVARFEFALLNDPITRVGRDPLRKLGSNDRLVGAARLAEAAGIQPDWLAVGIAAALCFCIPTDPSAVALHDALQTIGPAAILNRLCGLDSQRGIGRLVFKAWHELARGWQAGNVLLSLERLMWAWGV